MSLYWVEPWHPIFHRDIQASNIWFDWSKARSNGGVPEFLLAGFGYARFAVEYRDTASGFPDDYEDLDGGYSLLDRIDKQLTVEHPLLYSYTAFGWWLDEWWLKSTLFPDRRPVTKTMNII